MQEKLRELIAKWREKADYYRSLCAASPKAAYFEAKPRCYIECADELEVALAASEPAPQPEQIIEIDEDGKVHYPPCSCFTCPQHGELLKAIEQREQHAQEQHK